MSPQDAKVEIVTETVEKQISRARLYHAKKIGVGWRGQTFKVEEDGSVLVPPEAVAELVESFGFTTERPAGAAAPTKGNKGA